MMIGSVPLSVEFVSAAPFSDKDAIGEIDTTEVSVGIKKGGQRPIGTAVIRIKPNLSPEQLQETLFHELGHLADLWKNTAAFQAATHDERKAEQLIETALLIKEIEDSRKASALDERPSVLQAIERAFWESVERMRALAEETWRRIKEKREKGGEK